MIELAAAIRAGELSPVAVTDHYLRRTQELNEQVGAFFTVTAELAADQALAAEKAVTTADEVAALPPLTGVPIPITATYSVSGQPAVNVPLEHARPWKDRHPPLW